MKITLHNPEPSGTIAAIPSKSHVHRLLIAAALSEKEVVIRCDRTNEDIEATVRCLNALGAHISFRHGLFSVQPIRKPVDGAVLEVGESGSTLRFMLPVVASLGVTAHFHMQGRLPDRPLSPLREEMIAHGVSFHNTSANPLTISGQMRGGSFTFDGGVSSQFTTGLLLAIPQLHEPTSVTLTGKVESRPYIDLTLQTLRTLGYRVDATDNTFTVLERSHHTPTLLSAEGDWSNAAFMLALGAFSEKGVRVTGLDFHSTQGDRAIFELLNRFQKDATHRANDGIGFKKSAKEAVSSIDAADIPDLVPILSVVAASAVGTTVIENCGRLRLKESDRIASVCAMLNSLGGNASSVGDSIVIHGTGSLVGGTVDSAHDHRIAMSAAVASVLCREPVTILGAEAVRKSYPAFFDDLGTLCGRKLDMEEES